MSPDPQSPANPLRNRPFAYGLQLSLLLSLPVWLVAGIAAIWTLQSSPITAFEAALLLAIAVSEVLLLRHFLKTHAARDGEPAHFHHRVIAALGAPWPPLVRRTLLMGGLSAAYLQYYFWDVYLQIQSMPSVVVFVPVQPVA